MTPIARDIILILALQMALPVHAAAADHGPDMTGAKGQAVMFVLGTLDDYNGRYLVEGSDDVERFYCNEHVVAYVFRAYLERISREQHLDPAITEQWKQDCLVSFHSPAISTFINDFYPVSFDSAAEMMVSEGGGQPLRKMRMISTHLPHSTVLNAPRAMQLAFLAGAYFRYGRDNDFMFANASDKAHLIERLLVVVGCDSVGYASRPAIPVRNTVHFEPTTELLFAFRDWPGEWAMLRADTLVGLAPQEELAIYREVIRHARQGDYDGCPLPAAYEPGRFTVIPMSKRTPLPAQTPAQAEALADCDRASMTLRSIGPLVDESVISAGGVELPRASPVTLCRIGFSKDHRTAVTMIFYRAGNDRSSCYRAVTTFLSPENGAWRVTGYSLLEH